ncbi:uncharacterized protein LOC134771577 [Penaeus indicus]|uniref:uncharacterized protein LOC134771577 n=1 Tax=Penaeus indicus TaxID=29960 RepID=UPI00300D77FE
MASRFSWFLCSLLALLFCHDAAFAAKKPQQIDIKTLQEMTGKGYPAPNGKQYAVLHLTGKKLKDLKCPQIAYKCTRNVDANCNFAPVFSVSLLKWFEETFRHSEWQLIHTALRPMLQKWQANNSDDSDNTKCPESLYLYSYFAPDYIPDRIKFGYTCTQAIVTQIPNILNEKGCKNKTRIVVGFSKVMNKTEACGGYRFMKQNKITVYDLGSRLQNKQLNCRGIPDFEKLG